MELKSKVFEIRKDVLDMVYRAKTGHIGGDFSVCDILETLYFKQLNITPQTVQSPERARFVLSKGHCVDLFTARFVQEALSKNPICSPIRNLALNT